ncbi:CLUMA_CG014273, isoform A [Clunio marinus]|uniref:CLUMA_CG014273, isoform A n=1 Tax=Clunio marinus TaxID=568069 RepID=A0A1J1IMT4_9DIPT|nr:CLUMA_CG014273, isoform A [Clunio marinus]
MACPTFSKCCCCISLETGGLIIGWFNIILSVIALFVLGLVLSINIVALTVAETDEVVALLIFTVVAASIMLLFYVIIFVAAILLVIGISKRDHTKMVLFMILMAIGVILEFLNIVGADVDRVNFKKLKMGCPPTVNNFLCCCSLETGGLIIGWFNIIISFFGIIGFIIVISSAVVDGTGWNESPFGQLGAILTASLFLVYYIIVFIASVMLVQGVNNRNHLKMKLFLILMAIGVFLQFLQILIAGWSTFFVGLFFALLSLYFFICFIILYAVYLIYFAIVIAASIMLVIGTINNNHNQMLLFIVIMGVGVIVSFFQIFQLGVVFLVPTILSAVVAVYFFICVYSLYKRLKNESMKRTLNGTHPQYENVNLRNI